MSADNSALSAFAERYNVDTKKRLSEFDTPGGEAYMVASVHEPGRALYALVQEPSVPFRNTVYTKFSGGRIGSLMCPIDRGLMSLDLPKGNKQRLVTIFERPTGGALMSADGQVHPRVNTTRLRQSIVLSVLKALAAMHRKGVVHRSVMPQKIFFASPDSEDIMLGECYSCPPGYGNRRAMEPLELAFSHSAARGEGGESADYYQLGATLACLYFGKPLWKGREASALTIARVNQGSFWALTNGRDITGSLGVLVRGLMVDEPEERWGAREILDWYEGSSLNKRVGLKTWAMNRPATFRGVSYVDRRLLSDAFGHNPIDAAAYMRKVDFSTWAQASFRDEVVTDRLEQTIGIQPAGNITSATRVEDYRLIARMCMFLYPTGPIRYKHLAIKLDGLSSLLAYAFSEDDRDTIAVLSEILDNRFLSTLRDIVTDRDSGFTSAVNHLRAVMIHANSVQIGRGMERVLYVLNPNMPCLSIRFKDHWVGSPKQMLMTLEKIMDASMARALMTDRHVTAFLAARSEGLDVDLNKIFAAQHDPSQFALLTAEFFAKLQQETQVGKLPNVTNRIIDALNPVVKSIKNKKRRETVQSQLDKVKKSEDLSQLVHQINLVQQVLLDKREYSRAKRVVMGLERERNRLVGAVSPTDIDAMRMGYMASHWIALVLCVGVGVLNLV